MSSLAAALLAELDEDDLDALAELLAPRLAARLGGESATTPLSEDAWLNSREAARYLGISSQALYKHTAARTIPFEQERGGCKCWFRRSELDEWRRARRRPSH